MLAYFPKGSVDMLGGYGSCVHSLRQSALLNTDHVACRHLQDLSVVPMNETYSGPLRDLR